MSGQSIIISVLADTKKASSGLDSLGGTFKGLGVAAGIGLAAAGAAVGALLASSFKAVAEIERLNAQTGAAIASTGAAAGKSLESITGLADNLERLSGVEAESIQAGENLLLTFTNIKGTNFDAATKSALDMSVAMGTDMTSAATLVGKALNDPIKGVSALSRVGVQLTDDQKALIETMVATGDVAGAQGVILGELNTQFGGSAEAFGSTFLGTVEKVKNSFGTITEAFVTGLLPSATGVLNKINDLFLKIADSPAFASLITSINGFVSGLLSGDGAAGGFMSTVIGLASQLSPLSIIFQAIAPLLPQLAATFGTLATALGGALASVLPVVTSLVGTLVESLSGVFAAVLPVVVGLVTTLAGILADLAPTIATVAELFGGVLTTVITTLAPIITTIVEALGPVLTTVLTALAPIITLVAGVMVTLLTAIMPLLEPVLGLVTAVLGLIAPLLALVGPILTPLISLFTTLLTPILALIEPIIGLLVPVLQFLVTVLTFVVDGVAAALTWIADLVTGSGDAGDQLSDIWNNTMGMFSDFFTNTGGMIADFVSNTVGMFVDFGKNVGRAVSSLWNTATSTFSNGINQVVGFFAALPGQAMGALGGFIETVTGFGGNLISGLVGGIQGMANSVINAIKNTIGNAIDFAKKLLGIASPSKVFREIGTFTIAGLADGLSRVGPVTDAMARLSETVTGGLNADLMPVVAGSATGSRSGNSYQIVVQALVPTADTGRIIRDAIEEFENANGADR